MPSRIRYARLATERSNPRSRALDLLRPLMKAGLVRRLGTKKSGRYVLT